MRKKIAILVLCAAPLLAFAGLFGLQYNSATTNAVPSVPANPAAFTTVTNDLTANAFTLLSTQRCEVTVTLANAGAGAGIIYSNAVTGLQHTYLMTPGAATATNTFTLRCQANSMVAPTNATVLKNTTEIDYE